MKRLLRSRFFAASVASAVTAVVVGGAAWAAHTVPTIDPSPTDRWYACVSSAGKVKPATMKLNVQPTSCPAATDKIRSWMAGVNDSQVLNLAVESPIGEDEIRVEGLSSCTPSNADGPGCHQLVAAGVWVRLIAVATGGDLFEGWSGDCSGTESECVLYMDRTRNVTARFVDPAATTTSSTTTSTTSTTTTTTTLPPPTGTIIHTFPQVSCVAIVSGSMLTQKRDVTVSFHIPDSVTADGLFTITFPGGTTNLPNTQGGLTVTNYSNLSTTYQVQGGTFADGSIVNSGTATLVPTAGGPTVDVTQTAEIVAPDKFKLGNPSAAASGLPFPPGNLTRPTVSVQVQAPASGTVTVNAFQLTETTRLNNVLTAAVTCALPTTTLGQVPVSESASP